MVYGHLADSGLRQASQAVANAVSNAVRQTTEETVAT
jgi:hypothetical protein